MNEFNQIVENASDNEEAKGSSRTPTLNVFREKELINCGDFNGKLFRRDEA